jgi:hypothetical protein
MTYKQISYRLFLIGLVLIMFPYYISEWNEPVGFRAIIKAGWRNA